MEEVVTLPRGLGASEETSQNKRVKSQSHGATQSHFPLYRTAFPCSRELGQECGFAVSRGPERWALAFVWRGLGLGWHYLLAGLFAEGIFAVATGPGVEGGAMNRHYE